VKFRNKSAKARKCSELSDASTTDDASDPTGTYQSEDSELTDCPTTYLRAPPGLAPPPGLDHKAFAGQSHESANHSFKYWGGIISRQPKQTMHQRAEVPAAKDAPWRMGHGGRRPTATNQPSLHPPHQKQAANDTFATLKEALDKLAPTDIAAVRSLLDSKARNAGAGIPSRNAGWAASKDPVGSGPRQRPFTPSGANAKPTNRKPAMNGVDTGESLQTFLSELALIDDSRVVSVRKINALGFGSAPMLQDYFSKFGTVDRVMVAPTVIKSKETFGKSRTRPAGLGFVVMQTSEEVEAILKHGETHSLAGVDIKVCPFKSHSIDGTD